MTREDDIVTTEAAVRWVQRGGPTEPGTKAAETVYKAWKRGVELEGHGWGADEVRWDPRTDMVMLYRDSGIRTVISRETSRGADLNAIQRAENRVCCPACEEVGGGDEVLAPGQRWCPSPQEECRVVSYRED